MCGWDLSDMGSAVLPRPVHRRGGGSRAGRGGHPLAGPARRAGRRPPRRARLDSLADLLAAGVDAVTITTPPHTRRTLVLQAIAAGVPTIADKPLAPDAQGGRELVAAAEKAGVRRWERRLPRPPVDAGIQTLTAWSTSVTCRVPRRWRTAAG